MNKILLIVVILLSGCATTKEQTQLIVDEKNHKQYSLPSAEDRKLCDELPELKGKTFAYLYRYAGNELPKEYYECARKHKELSEWIDRFEKDTTK